METPIGHKKTEVGILPDEWEVTPLSTLVSEFRGGAPLKPSDFVPTGIKVLPKGGVGHTGWLQIHDNDLQYCSSSYASTHRTNQVDRSYTIVVLRDLVPSGPSIGLMVQINEDETYVLAQGVYGFKVNGLVEPRFLIQLSNTNWYRKLMNSIMVGSTQVHITNTAFKRSKIPLPPLPEQRAIAEALSDVDALLAGLDKLITKKRDLKQAAMQQLLTGKTRLPGFIGKWEVKRLDQFAPLQRGFDLPSSQIQRGDYPVVYSNGVQNRHAKFMVKAPGVVTGRSGTIGNVHFVDEDFWPHNTALWVTDFKSNDPKFVFYFLSNVGLERFGTGSGVPTLNRNDVHEFQVCVPATSSEQTAIAEVLSNMDAEIATLETRLEKTRALKQGMMQELLTGRIRLA
jgi:type I restriction enzyme S subunit